MTHRSFDRGAVIAVLCLLLAGCQSTSGPVPDSPVIAEVAGTSVTLAELDAFVKDELFQQQTRGGNPSRLHELRDAALDRLLAQRAVELTAAAQGIDTDTLLEQVVEELGPVTDAEISEFYTANKARLPNSTLEQLEPSIRSYLEELRPQAAAEKIAAQADTKRFLAPPRLDIAAIGPALGPEDAAVTIVEFSDFQCPYCRRAGPVMKALLDRYPDDLRLVYRHLPLDFHQRARAAAEAAACAHEQGAFWPYHDLVFENPKALSDEDLAGYAAEVGIDGEALAACLASGRAGSAVDTDLAAAQSAGITGTPAFVVNGILISGLQSEEAFDRVIQAELARGAEATP